MLLLRQGAAFRLHLGLGSLDTQGSDLLRLSTICGGRGQGVQRAGVHTGRDQAWRGVCRGHAGSRGQSSLHLQRLLEAWEQVAVGGRVGESLRSLGAGADQRCAPGLHEPLHKAWAVRAREEGCLWQTPCRCQQRRGGRRVTEEEEAVEGNVHPARQDGAGGEGSQASGVARGGVEQEQGRQVAALLGALLGEAQVGGGQGQVRELLPAASHVGRQLSSLGGACRRCDG